MTIVSFGLEANQWRDERDGVVYHRWLEIESNLEAVSIIEREFVPFRIPLFLKNQEIWGVLFRGFIIRLNEIGGKCSLKWLVSLFLTTALNAKRLVCSDTLLEKWLGMDICPIVMNLFAPGQPSFTWLNSSTPSFWLYPWTPEGVYSSWKFRGNVIWVEGNCNLWVAMLLKDK